MATCLPGWEWNQNSLGQDPCSVGSRLDATCRGLGQYNYAQLDPDEHYVSPSKDHPGDLACDCNTVMYSLIMACATCQDATAYPWLTWVGACEGVYVSAYPSTIPQGTAIPQWAFFNVTRLAGGLYDDGNAKSIGRDPEAFPKTLNTKTTSGGPGSTGVVSGGTSSGGKHIGAIVGGVVGGVGGLAVVAVVVLLLIQRNRKNRDKSSQPQQQYQEEPTNSWKVAPSSPAYDPSVSSGPTVLPSVPYQTYNPRDSYPSHTGMSQSPSPVTYVTPLSGYGGR